MIRKKRKRMLVFLIVLSLCIIFGACSQVEPDASLEVANRVFQEVLEDDIADFADKMIPLEFEKKYELKSGIEIIFKNISTFKKVDKTTGIYFDCAIKNNTNEDYELPDEIEHMSVIRYKLNGSNRRIFDEGSWVSEADSGLVLKAGESKNVQFYSDEFLVEDAKIISSKEEYGYVVGLFAIKLQDKAYYVDFFNKNLELNK